MSSKYYVIFDSHDEPYAYTPSEWGAREFAQELNGYYREYTEEEE